MLSVHFSILVLAIVSVAGSFARADEDVKPDWKYAEKRLKKAGVKSAFIRVLKENYEPDDFKDVRELNLLLFLRKTDQHAVQVTDEAADRVREFMKDNRETLAAAEKKHQVSAPVIASLLWMESRYGQNLGRFHVASVFLDLLQVDRPEVVRDLKERGAFRFSDRPSKKDLAKVSGRARKKAAWALGELKAMEKMHRIHGESVLEFRGSFAGAYGMPQFLPSSYSRWAQAAKKSKAAPNLAHADDAIQSVAFYLHSNGWRAKREKTHFKALMNYNNSRDYANAILKLAKRASEDRSVASGDR